jgi:hypothetical protein
MITRSDVPAYSARCSRSSVVETLHDPAALAGAARFQLNLLDALLGNVALAALTAVLLAYRNLLHGDAPAAEPPSGPN